MKLRVQKEDILSSLQKIQGIVDKKSTMPILNHFLLKVSNKSASLMATDLDIALQDTMKAEIEGRGGLCIPARKLFEIAREVEGELLLEIQENNWIQVTSGKSTFKLMGLPPEDFPSLPELETKDQFVINASTLSDMIDKTIYATGESDTRYTLNGLLLHLIPGKKEKLEARIVGTDGHRLSMTRSEIQGKVESEQKLILPKKAASELRKLIDSGEPEEVTVTIGKNHVSFSLGDTNLTTRLIEGNYPDYEQVIPQQNEKKVLIERSMFFKALKRASIMSREKTNAVRFDLETNKITLISMNPDIGEAREEIDVKYKGDKMTIGFNAKYIMDILQSMDGESVRLELDEPLSPALIFEEGNDNYTCVVMPMRT